MHVCGGLGLSDSIMGRMFRGFLKWHTANFKLVKGDFG